MIETEIIRCARCRTEYEVTYKNMEVLHHTKCSCLQSKEKILDKALLKINKELRGRHEKSASKNK